VNLPSFFFLMWIPCSLSLSPAIRRAMGVAV
jgi:hypothetical protein